MRFARAIIAGSLAFVASCNAPCGAQSRGQTSYTMPLARESVPPPTVGPDAPIWSRAVDDPPQTEMHDLLAVGPDVVAFASGGRVCGFRLRDGQRRWCDRAGSAPAFRAGTVAYSAPYTDEVRAVDARNGRLEWRAENAQAVWTTADGFLVAEEQAPKSPEQTFGERGPDGRVRWHSPMPPSSSALAILGGYAFRPLMSDGAWLTTDQSVLRLGRDGKALPALSEAISIVDVRPPHVVYVSDAIEPSEDHIITVHVAVANLADAAIQADYHLEPDYAANLTILNPENSPGFSAPTVRVDANDVFIGLLSQKVYRYALADPTAQCPLLLASDARLLGGPYRGWLYVARANGVWALRPEATRIRARLLIASKAEPSQLWTAGDDVYVALSDGRVIGVDARSGQRVFQAKPCAESDPQPRVATTSNRVLIVCTASSRTLRVSVFQRGSEHSAARETAGTPNRPSPFGRSANLPSRTEAERAAPASDRRSQRGEVTTNSTFSRWRPLARRDILTIFPRRSSRMRFSSLDRR